MEEKDNQEIPQKAPKTRKVSLFKRRKKPDIRPFVREKKEKRVKKLLKFLLILIFLIFAICLFLYAVRYLLVATIFSKNTNIISPQSKNFDDMPIDQILNNNGIEFNSLNISTSSGAITFKTNNTTVIFDQEKSLSDQTIILKEILRQLSLNGKRASLVDLRYNKPIVKF